MLKALPSCVSFSKIIFVVWSILYFFINTMCLHVNLCSSGVWWSSEILSGFAYVVLGKTLNVS